MNNLWIIDDDEVFTYLAETKLEMATGFDHVKSFSYAGVALEELKRSISEGISLPSIILLDINMPRMSGWDFLDNIKKLNLNLDSAKIFIISSSSSSSDQKKVEEYPEVDFLTKPLTNEKIEMFRKYF